MTPLIRHSYCNPVAGYGYEEWDPFFRNSYLAGALSSEGRHMIRHPYFVITRVRVHGVDDDGSGGNCACASCLRRELELGCL